MKIKKKLFKVFKILIVFVLVLSICDLNGLTTFAEESNDHENTVQEIEGKDEDLKDDDVKQSDQNLVQDETKETLSTDNNKVETTMKKAKTAKETHQVQSINNNSDETIFDYGGNYSIYYILNNYNIFTKEDASCGHTIGAVAVGGEASFGSGIGRDNYNHTTPSYFGGSVTKFNSYLGKNKIFLTKYEEAIPSWAYDSYDIRINSHTNPNDQYINFDKAFQSISNEISKYAQDSHRIIVDKSVDSELYSFNGNKVTLIDGYIYEFKNFIGIDEINVVTDQSIDQYGDVIILCTETGTVHTPQIALNGSHEIPGQNVDKEVGKGCGVAFMLPHATVVNDQKAFARHIGHIIAPNARIENVNGDSNGCFIAKSVNIPGTESHMWPYNGRTVQPISTALKAKKYVDHQTPTTSFDFECSLIAQPDGSEIEYHKVIENSGQDITFPTIHNIQVEGEYIFQMKEVIPSDDMNYSYDDIVYYASVSVMKIGTKFVIDSITYGTEYDVNNGVRGYVNIPTFNNETIVDKKIDIPVKKEWNDSKNADGCRPSYVVVELYKNNQATGQTITLNEKNQWSGRFTNLDFSENGKTIQYTVKEVNVDSHYNVSMSGSASHGFTITNTHKPITTSIPVKKVWNDYGNQDGLRPDEIIVKLLANGNEEHRLVLNKANQWQGIFANLPVYKNGVKIDYTIQELSIDENYKSQITGNAVDGFTITNTHTPDQMSIPVRKIWNDHGNQDGLRPENITVHLLNGNDIVGTLILSDENNWSGSFNNLPVNHDGQPIDYHVVEEVVGLQGYTTDIKGTASKGFVITNTHTVEKISKQVTKIWDDHDNQDGVRPNEVKVQLYANATAIGEPVTLSSDNGWTYEWNNLDKYYNEEEIVYTVREMNLDSKYSVSYSDDTFEITNHYDAEKTSKTVFKVWDDHEDQDGLRPTEIKVQLYADGNKVGDAVTLNLANKWSYTWDHLDKYADGKEIAYTVKEVEEYEGYTTQYSEDTMIITNTHELDKTSQTVIKKWDDNNNQDGIRPNEVKVQLYADASPIGEPIILSNDNEWTYTWNQLDKKANGKEIVYSVKEISHIDGYVPKYDKGTNDEFIITNVHQPATLNIPIIKNWEDNDNAYHIRPESIVVHLNANGKLLRSATLSQENGWQYTFKNLDEFNNGKRIHYTLEEVSVYGYETSVSRNIITNSIILGSLTIEKVSNGTTTPSNTTFTITNENGFIKTVKYEEFENGKYTLDNLPIGEYTVVESQGDVNGYTLKVTGNNQKVSIVDKSNQTIQIINDYEEILGSLTIEKVSNGTTTPNDTTFTITNENGFIKTVKYEEFDNGKYTLDNLPIGEYTVVESQGNVNGYTLKVTGNNQKVSIVDKSNQMIQIINDYTPIITKLIIYKVDQDHNFLEGADFQMIREDGTVINPIKGKARFEFNNLIDGNYKVIETVTPDGYEGIGEFNIVISHGLITCPEYGINDPFETLTVENTNDGDEPEVFGDEIDEEDYEEWVLGDEEDTEETDDTVETSDDQNIMKYTVLSFISIALLFFLKRKVRHS